MSIDVEILPQRVGGGLRDAVAYPAVSAFGLTVDGATPAYYLGGARFVSDLTFTRAGTGVAIGGGSSATFAANEPRFHDGELQIDAGGTNLIPFMDDFSNAAWTKTNLAAPVAADGPAGAGTAWYMAETTTSAAHTIGQHASGLAAATQFTVHALLKVTGRDYLEWDLYNSATTAGVRTRFSLLDGGSVVSSYPAALGSGGSAMAAGILEYGDGFWLIWQTITFGATTTGLRPTLKLMSSATTTSYAGDTGKGITLAGMWAIAGASLPVNFLEGTRAAESFIAPIADGFYLGRRVDGGGEVIEAFEASDGWNLAPRPGKLWIEEAQAYELAAYDTVTRANTAPGDLGTATDGGSYSLLYNPGAFPMQPASNGFVLDNAFAFTPAAGATGAVYATRALDATVKYMSADVAWDMGGGSANNTAFALLTSNDAERLTEVMPVHIVMTRGAMVVQKWPLGGAVTLGEIKPVQGSLNRDGTYYPASFAIHDDVLVASWCGEEIVVQDAIFREITSLSVWELYSEAANASNTDWVKAKNLVASTAEIGSVPTFTAAAPVNLVVPFASGAPVAGNTYTANSTQGGWSSNSGAITYSYQWQFDGVDIPGATNFSLVTVNGVDEGKTVSVRVTATNGVGSTSATSAPSAPLA